VTLVYDFLVKLVKLPLKFFDTKMVGDILQRVGDHQRIEYFLTSIVLSIGLTIVNLIVFSIVLVSYNLKIFLFFLTGTVLYLLWMRLFLKRRGELDFVRFRQMSVNQNMLVQIIMGMPEIKLNNCGGKKIRDWVKIQEDLFASGVQSVALSQNQQTGCALIRETQNILITFLAASLALRGEITLGMMLAVQFILGQLNGPVEQLLHFVAATQDARLSLARIEEVHRQRDEAAGRTEAVPPGASIGVANVSFQYGDPYSEKVLKDISLVLPNQKVTAIVGTSGSGKTTLIKLLLGFYEPTGGLIKIGAIPLDRIRPDLWRDRCGLVMQDGYIFSDTIANNIALKDETVDEGRLRQAARIANIDIAALPLGYRTRIGADGHGLSQGQKQRILIARAVYKDPEYLFFDEATNSLDTSNEAAIMKNLEHFFRGRTVTLVAHRLSTVRHADQIVVLDQGVIAETGSHDQLIMKKGVYYNLVKNQLELGN
jgi:ATP-binding cassette subfamily B protein